MWAVEKNKGIEKWAQLKSVAYLSYLCNPTSYVELSNKLQLELDTSVSIWTLKQSNIRPGQYLKKLEDGNAAAFNTRSTLIGK